MTPSGPTPAALAPPGRGCPACGYDLTGGHVNADGQVPRCPECGQHLTAAAEATARERRFFRLAGTRIAVVVATIVAATAAAVVLFPDRAIWVVPLLVLLIAPVPVLLAVSAE